MKQFQYAISGLIAALRSEQNLRIHVAAALLVIVAGSFFHLKEWEWVAVILCIFSVIAMELMNTALEQLCNVVMPHQHPIIKRAKDVAAAAVLIAACGAAVTGFIIFLPKVLFYFNF